MPAPDPARFAAAYGAAPGFAVHAPGRVNLIGEHIDYADLAVLPMTIDRGITLTGALRPDHIVRLHSTVPGCAPLELGVDRAPEAFPAGHWGNYVGAALGAARELGADAGFDAVIDTDLPAAAGLSSSSALVVAVTLAALAAADIEGPPRFELADLLARAERGTGTRGGNMDQTVILAGSRDGPVLLTRHPPSARPLPLPDGWVFVVAHSLEAAEKSGGAQAAYNTRRRDVEQATRYVAASMGREGEPLRLLIEEFEEALLEAVERLPPRLSRRLRHVVGESRRVEQAVAALLRGDRAGFGAHMSASHASLRDDFEVSTRGLDRLVELAMAAGADGARLTGAGLGGCVIALTKPDAVPALFDSFDREYFAPAGCETPAELETVRFAVAPAPPARATGIATRRTEG